MRSLTDGDIVYEHEFVSLPPKTKRSRKRDTVSAHFKRNRTKNVKEIDVVELFLTIYLIKIGR